MQPDHLVIRRQSAFGIRHFRLHRLRFMPVATSSLHFQPYVNLLFWKSPVFFALLPVSGRIIGREQREQASRSALLPKIAPDLSLGRRRHGLSPPRGGL